MKRLQAQNFSSYDAVKNFPKETDPDISSKMPLLVPAREGLQKSHNNFQEILEM